MLLPPQGLQWDTPRELPCGLPEAEATNLEVVRLMDFGQPYLKTLQTATAEQVGIIIIATHGGTGRGGSNHGERC